MTPQEAAKVLSICGAYDNRKIDQFTAIAWSEVLGDITFEDARAAVISHYRTEKSWLMPSDIVKKAKKSSWYDGLVKIHEWQPDADSLRLKESAGFTDEEFGQLVTEFKERNAPEEGLSGISCPPRNWGDKFDNFLQDRALDRGVTLFTSRRFNPKTDQWIYNR